MKIEDLVMLIFARICLVSIETRLVLETRLLLEQMKSDPRLLLEIHLVFETRLLLEEIRGILFAVFHICGIKITYYKLLAT